MTDILRAKLEVVDDEALSREIRLELAAIYDELLDDADESVSCLRSVLDDSVGDTDVSVRLEGLLGREGRWDEVLEVLEERERGLEDVGARELVEVQIGQILDEKLGQSEEAISRYAEVLRRAPELDAAQSAKTALEALAVRESLEEPACRVLEEHYRSSECRDDLVRINRAQLGRLEDPYERQQLLRQMASVQEGSLDDSQGAFDSLALALGEVGCEPDVLGELDRLSNSLGSQGQLAELYEAQVSASLNEELGLPMHRRPMRSNLTKVQEAYARADDVMLLSHSVAPAVDSVPALRRYAEVNGVISGKWHLVTGDRKSIYEHARTSYLADLELGQQSADDFVHSENFVLVDKERRIRGVYNGTRSQDVGRLIEDIATLRAEYTP